MWTCGVCKYECMYCVCVCVCVCVWMYSIAVVWLAGFWGVSAQCCLLGYKHCRRAHRASRYIYTYIYTLSCGRIGLFGRNMGRFADSGRCTRYCCSRRKRSNHIVCTVELGYCSTVQGLLDWWVLQHCTGFARLGWGRLRVHPSFHLFKSICC